MASRNKTTYPVIDLGRWQPGNAWIVSAHIDNSGNVTELEVTHTGPGPKSHNLDYIGYHSHKVRPFDDLLAQIRFACIEASGSGEQMRLPFGSY